MGAGNILLGTNAADNGVSAGVFTVLMATGEPVVDITPMREESRINHRVDSALEEGLDSDPSKLIEEKTKPVNS